MQIIDVAHSHDAAAQAVALVRAGRAEALMKGSLHTDELMGAVVASGTGLRTERRVSHVFIADVPTYPRALLITDAAINIDPTLDDKVDIVQNAIDLAHILGVPEPKVAILAAVETVTAKMRATIDASALCKMADRGQITGGILDGPLAFDNAVSIVAAKTKGIRSAGGRARRHPAGAGPGVGQHARQAARIPRRRPACRRGGGRERAHRAHQPRRQRRNPLRLLRHRAADGQRQTQARGVNGRR